MPRKWIVVISLLEFHQQLIKQSCGYSCAYASLLTDRDILFVNEKMKSLPPEVKSLLPFEAFGKNCCKTEEKKSLSVSYPLLRCREYDYSTGIRTIKKTK